MVSKIIILCNRRTEGTRANHSRVRRGRLPCNCRHFGHRVGHLLLSMAWDPVPACIQHAYSSTCSPYTNKANSVTAMTSLPHGHNPPDASHLTHVLRPLQYALHRPGWWTHRGHKRGGWWVQTTDEQTPLGSSCWVGVSGRDTPSRHSRSNSSVAVRHEWRLLPRKKP